MSYCKSLLGVRTQIFLILGLETTSLLLNISSKMSQANINLSLFMNFHVTLVGNQYLNV